jgi:hypothetical protein
VQVHLSLLDAADPRKPSATLLFLTVTPSQHLAVQGDLREFAHAGRPDVGGASAWVDLMGLFDKLTGTERAADGVVPRPAAEVRAALLGLNRSDVPYVIRDGRAEGVESVGERRMLEPAWQRFFARNQVSRVFQVRMRLVPEKNEVRSLDQQYEVTWVGDTPRLSISAEVQRGQV